MSIVLYELTGADERCFSPFCWRALMALAHKGLAPERRAIRFSDKHEIAFSGQDRVPVLVDGDRVVPDSWDIACHLEDCYPDAPSLFGGDQGRALARFVGLACPFFGAGGWDIPEFTLPPDFAGALHGLGHCRFLQDPRDEIVDISHLSIWARCLPHAILTETRGTGHGFETGDLSPVMAAILGAGGGS